MVEIPMICRYCGGAVHLVPAAKVYGPAAAKRLGLEREKFYQCQNCNARVGCHKGSTRPLGNLANEALRMKRMETHQIFDSFWKERGMSRTQGYMPPDGLPAMRSSKVRCTQKISKKKEMRLMMLRKPTCADCPHNLQYMERLPIKKKGVTMHLGERFCVAGKRARKFKRSDPKTYVPSWCPRLKAPCELRIYGFKNQREWRMHRSMRAYLGEDTSPSAFRYAVRYEGHTDLAPYEFFECCNVKSDDEILGAAVQHYDVVEIDDGIKPAFFYKTEHGYELLFSFDAKTAKKNIREEID